MGNCSPILLAALLIATPAAAENRLQVPPEAKGRLMSGQAETGELGPDASSGRYRDCWVANVEPGSDAVITAQSPDFDPVLSILPEATCDGRQPLYVSGDADAPTPNARVAFNVRHNSFAVIVTRASPEQGGLYALTLVEEDPEAAPRRTYTVSEPERLVRALYADHGPDLGDPAVIDRVFAPAVGTALKRLNAETRGIGLGFDFLVNGQDVYLTELEIGMGVWLDRSGLIEVRFLNMGEPQHLQFHMRETPDGWRVEDIESRAPDGGHDWLLSRSLGLELGIAVAP